MDEELRIVEKVQLHNAPMVIGLSGWGNAGEVSTFTVKYFVDKLCAKKFGEIPTERFHDYLIQRPIVSIKEGVIESYIPPKNEFFYSSGLYPKAAYHMLKKISLLIGVDIDLSDLKKRAQSFEAQLEREAMSQPQLRRIIEDMRRRRGPGREPTYIQ